MPHTISIGRGTNNDIVLQHQAISTYHAIVTFGEDGNVIYTDNSTNGTQVNGKFVRGRSVYVKPGDQILLPGRVLLDWRMLNSRNPYSGAGAHQQGSQTQSQSQVQEMPEPEILVVDEAQEAPRRNVCGLLSLIFSLVAIPFYVVVVLSYVGWVFSLAAFILGFIGVFRSPRGKAIAGMILSILVPVIAALIIVAAVGSLMDL
ncbi:MAG: FHA domain-containing protein [Ruminococcus flavefaciens]|nr:FHA domain-containing protein [Ruminococcus flavefaciens]